MNEDDGEIVFIPELNTLGVKICYEMSCDNWNSFYSVFNLEELNRFLKSQIEYQNYEAAAEIRKHIEQKHGNKNN